MKSKCLKYFLFVFLVIHSYGFSDADKQNQQKPNGPKTVFLTGAAGFIGSNFLEYMFDKYPKYHFIVLDALTYAGLMDNIPKRIQESDRFKFYLGTVTDRLLVDRLMSSANFVVHFAAETHVARSLADDHVFFDTDVMGTRAMMEALVNHHRKVERFIHISTSEVYGTADYQPMGEAHPLKPKSPYAAAKVGADRLVFAYSCCYDIPTVIVRPFNNYGPRQHPEKLIPRFISAAMQGKPLTIHGKGEQKRDWIHTYDVAVALDKILHTPTFNKVVHQEINIGSGVAISVLDIAKMILKKFNLSDTNLVFVADRPGQVDCHIAAIGKARLLLDWTPSISFEDGLQKTIDWYKQNPAYCEKLIDNAIVKIKTQDGSVKLQ